MIARLLAAIDNAVDTFLNAVADKAIAAWLARGQR